MHDSTWKQRLLTNIRNAHLHMLMLVQMFHTVNLHLDIMNVSNKSVLCSLCHVGYIIICARRCSVLSNITEAHLGIQQHMSVCTVKVENAQSQLGRCIRMYMYLFISNMYCRLNVSHSNWPEDSSHCTQQESIPIQNNMTVAHNNLSFAHWSQGSPHTPLSSRNSNPC